MPFTSLRSALKGKQSGYLKLPPHLQGDCFMCCRSYSTVNNLKNFSEIPCRPVKLFPCGHVIGYNCAARWFRRYATQICCPLCRQQLTSRPVSTKSSRVMYRAIEFVCETRWFSWMDDEIVTDL